MTRPWFRFYSRDWLDNKELRRCSPTARALLADLMCIAHEGMPYGYLADKLGALCDDYLVARCMMRPTAFRTAVIELEKAERIHRSEEGAIFIKRMVEDEELRCRRAAGGKLGGNPTYTNKVNLQRTNKVNLHANLPLQISDNLSSVSEGKPPSRARARADSDSSSLSFPEEKTASFDFLSLFSEMYGVWKKKAGRQLAQQALSERLQATNGNQAELAQRIRDKALAFAGSESMANCPAQKWPKLEDWIRNRRDEDDAQPPEQEDGW